VRGRVEAIVFAESDELSACVLSCDENLTVEGQDAYRVGPTQTFVPRSMGWCETETIGIPSGRVDSRSALRTGTPMQSGMRLAV